MSCYGNMSCEYGAGYLLGDGQRGGSPCKFPAEKGNILSTL